MDQRPRSPESLLNNVWDCSVLCTFLCIYSFQCLFVFLTMLILILLLNTHFFAVFQHIWCHSFTTLFHAFVGFLKSQYKKKVFKRVQYDYIDFLQCGWTILSIIEQCIKCSYCLNAFIANGYKNKWEIYNIFCSDWDIYVIEGNDF